MKKISIFRRMTMPLSDLEDYYRLQRYDRFEKNIPLSWIKIRRMIHHVLLLVLRIRQIWSGLSIIVIGDQRRKTVHPIIYACTHIGWDDIEVAYCALKSPSWLFLGDPKGLYKSVDGFMLWINGMICCETADKSDRYIAKETCVKLLKQRGNLLIFPEGAWNISENLPVMRLFTGTAGIAIRSGAEIVPVAIEQYEKSFVVNIGGNINSSEYALFQKQDLSNRLRDEMCTLKWEIFEKYAIDSRYNIPLDYWDNFLSGIEDQMNDNYTLKDIEVTRYHDKQVTESFEVFEHLQHLISSKKMLFCFARI